MASSSPVSCWNLPTYTINSPHHQPLLVNDHAGAPAKNRRPVRAALLVLIGILAVGLLVGPKDYKERYEKLLTFFRDHDGGIYPYGMYGSSMSVPAAEVTPATEVARGVAEGVSAKSFRSPVMGVSSFSWTNQMLTWQRTGFHFQPQKNWMNDVVTTLFPFCLYLVNNGASSRVDGYHWWTFLLQIPTVQLFYKGWYHFFYQYNPDGPVWGNIVWGHAISKDLVHWHHLPIAMTADQWYDINGVWTGSATILPDGQIVMLYTGSTNETVQVQNLAYPADPSDPLLLEWVKYPNNPVLVPPPGIHFQDFRDPTTAWKTSDAKWRITIGSKVNKTGVSLVYDTVDFKNFELLDVVMHAVPGTGMWECVDFYPVSRSDKNGLDTSDNGPAVKHVLKASFDDDRNDYYAIGTYDERSGTWVPDDPTHDVGLGLRYDYGIFYASKTFYDQDKKRRILWSWIKETDSEAADLRKGWASLQAIPRTVVFDKKTGSNLLQWPVEEVEKLRLAKKSFENVELEAGTIVPLELGSASQLDIIAEFEISEESLEIVSENDVDYMCSSCGGATHRGALGPFGLLVLADKNQTEQTPIYFYVAKGTDGNVSTFFCADQSRSSAAYDVDKNIYGSTVPVLKGEKLSMRILVDHSIVESFAQGGRTCITSRVYPTKSIYDEAQLFLFNNATQAKVSASVQVWQMSSANF